MKIEKKFSLLIAGPDHKCVTKMVGLCEDFPAKIIISRWDNGSNQLVLPQAQFVTSPIPSVESLNLLHNSQNIYLQVTTVLAGLEKVDTPYVIKVRSDEFFSNIKIMAETFNPAKLLSANIFVRDVSYKPYHISDHLFIGRTDLLRNAFSALKQYIEMASGGGGGRDPLGILNMKTPAEMKIAIFYLQACGYEISQLVRLCGNSAFNVMQREFDIFDVDRLIPFEISSSSAGKIGSYRKFIRRDSVLGLRHITSIDQMAPQGKLSQLYQRLAFKLKRLLAKGYIALN